MAYPNPAKETVRFYWEEAGVEKVRVEIYNMAGERIATLEAALPGNGLTWDATGIAPGIYLYQVVLTLDGQEKRLAPSKLAVVE